MENNVLNNEAFDCLDEETKTALVSLFDGIKGKSVDESLPIIINFMNTLPKKMKFTKEQREAMINVFMENLSINEKKQMLNLIRLIGL